MKVSSDNLYTAIGIYVLDFNMSKILLDVETPTKMKLLIK